MVQTASLHRNACLRVRVLQCMGPDCLRAGVCRPCVETELTATKKSATDGN